MDALPGKCLARTARLRGAVCMSYAAWISLLTLSPDPWLAWLRGEHEPDVGAGLAMTVDPEALAASVPHMVDAVRRRLAAGAGGVAAVAVAADPERQFEELADAARRCAAAGAQAVVLAGGPLSAAARRLAGEGIAVVEAVPSACALVLERIREAAVP